MPKSLRLVCFKGTLAAKFSRAKSGRPLCVESNHDTHLFKKNKEPSRSDKRNQKCNKNIRREFLLGSDWHISEARYAVEKRNGELIINEFS